MTAVDLVVDGDVPLAVRDFGGSGRAVLLLHGAGRNLADWGSVAPLLADSLHPIAVDLRCHGASGDGAWQWDAVLGDLERVVMHLGLEAPAVVGHSLGGMLAARWAVAHPECPAAVNLDGHGFGRFDLCAGYDAQDAICLAAELRAHRLLRAGQAPTRFTPEQVDALVQAQQQELAAYAADPEVVEQVVRRGVRECNGELVRHPDLLATTRISRAIDTQDLIAIYRTVRCPLLVVDITGVDSVPPAEPDMEWVRPLLAAYRRGLHAALTALAHDHLLVEVEQLEATHGMILTHPRQTAALLLRYLDSR